MAKKVVLDTDPGSDIDDAVCIGYLLANPACDLLGITTVTGKPDRRARLASIVCHAYGKGDIPLHPGAALPLLIESHQPEVPQDVVLPRWPHREEFESNSAVPFLRRIIRENPHEIELVTIGALTNIALLFALDPEIPSLIAGLTVMGGRFTCGIPVHTPIEHNIRCDPHAAEIVFRATGIPRVRVVGLDVTLVATQHREEIRKSFITKEFEPILDMAQAWFQRGEWLCYHDIVAASTLFRPELFSFRRGHIRVETSGGLMGFTHFEESEDGPHEVAASIDREGFLDHFCTVTGCLRV